MPSGVDISLKLMLPGERCEVMCQPSFGYSTSVDPAPAGVPIDEALYFKIEMVSFEKEGHPQAMDADEMIVWASRQKSAANALYGKGRTEFAIKKYDKMLRTLKNFRQVDTEEQEDALTALKVTTMGNLAAAYIQTQQYPEAIRQCEAALTLDPDNGKIWMRKARALSLNGDYAHAVLNLDVLRNSMGELAAEIDEIIAMNKRREKAAEQKQKQDFLNFFHKKQGL